MADVSITKTVPRQSLVSQMNWRKVVIREPDEYYWINTGNTRATTTWSLDLSVIPADAIITNCVFNQSYSATYSGNTWSSVMDGGTAYGSLNGTTIKNWLNDGHRDLVMFWSYQALTQSQYVINKDPPWSSTAVYSNISMTITYQAGTQTWRLHYGIGGNWVECLGRGTKDGAYIPTIAYYGINNQWVKLDNTDIEE